MARGKPFQKGQPRPKGAGRKKGVQNKATVEQKAFMRGILESEEYREAFRARVLKGDASMELLMHHYVMGKPKDTLAIEQMPPLLVVDKLEGK